MNSTTRPTITFTRPTAPVAPTAPVESTDWSGLTAGDVIFTRFGTRYRLMSAPTYIAPTGWFPAAYVLDVLDVHFTRDNIAFHAVETFTR